MSRLRAALRRRDEEGMSLVELIVAMGIFTVVISVFMSGLVIMTRNTARAQAVSDAGDSVRRVFQRMDREIRYSSSVNAPGSGASGAVYVEYVITALPAGEQPLCTQWRYVPSSRTLQVRTWRDVAPRTPTAWSTAVVNMRNDVSVAAQRPFQWTPAGTQNSTRQRLRVVLDVGPGPAGTNARAGAQLDSTFVARNTSTASQSNRDVDNNGISDTPVCGGVGRP